MLEGDAACEASFGIANTLMVIDFAQQPCTVSRSRLRVVAMVRRFLMRIAR
jgi:hypothetical protein